MNILSLRQNPIQPQTRPAFRANQKIPQEKIIKGISDSLMSSVKTAGDSFELTNIINNPQKSKVFFATLGSLMTAAAVKITELLTGGTDDKSSSDSGDIIELSTTNAAKKERKTRKKQSLQDNHDVNVQKFIKHAGKAGVSEKALEFGINNISEKLNLDIEHKNSLVSLYNQFCGHNHKGISYDNKNNEIANSSIAESIAKELEQCSDINSIEELVSQYKTYTSQKKAQVDTESEDSISKNKILLPDCIKTRPNIKNAYESLGEEERLSVDGFLLSLESDIDSYQRKSILQSINKNYSEFLPEIASIYTQIGEVNKDNKRLFTSMLANCTVATDALKNYGTDNVSKAFNFIEYNSLVYNNISEESKEELASLRNKGDISEIILNCFDENYNLTMHNIYLGKSFKTIVKTFDAIKGNSSRRLNNFEKEYTYKDVDAEILGNDYPLLKKYLSVKDKKYLNQGKEDILLNIYTGGNINKDIFTLHSYLRFLERFVMPELNMEEGKYLSTNQVKRKYLDKLAQLKLAITNALQEQVTVFEYNLDAANIKAPKIKIPYGKNDDFYEITLNDQGKIHTIF